jgi:hypothetical protein
MVEKRKIPNIQNASAQLMPKKKEEIIYSRFPS